MLNRKRPRLAERQQKELIDDFIEGLGVDRQFGLNIQIAIHLRWKACGKIAVFFNFVQNLKHTHFYAKFIVDSISENRFNVSCL